MTERPQHLLMVNVDLLKQTLQSSERDIATFLQGTIPTPYMVKLCKFPYCVAHSMRDNEVETAIRALRYNYHGSWLFGNVF